MRPSRNRNWGNPQLVKFLERLRRGRESDQLNGLLVGDMSQPRGGPLLFGHSSHQVGLDVDIWFTPMPNHVQSREEREVSSATDVVAVDLLDVNPEMWTPADVTRSFAPLPSDPASPACSSMPRSRRSCAASRTGADRDWLSKVRPWYGHAEHFHVRLACPADSAECKPRPSRTRAMAVVTSSTSGSWSQLCIRRRPFFRLNRNRS